MPDAARPSGGGVNQSVATMCETPMQQSVIVSPMRTRLLRTRKRRPDLLAEADLSAEEREWLDTLDATEAAPLD